MKWISVNDRLPEDDTNVMGYGYWDSEIDRLDDFRSTGYVNYDGGTWEIIGGAYYTAWLNGVTHWMPLPEPPK